MQIVQATLGNASMTKDTSPTSESTRSSNSNAPPLSGAFAIRLGALREPKCNASLVTFAGVAGTRLFQLAWKCRTPGSSSRVGRRAINAGRSTERRALLAGCVAAPLHRPALRWQCELAGPASLTAFAA